MTLASLLADREQEQFPASRLGALILKGYVGVITDWRLRLALGFSIAIIAVALSTSRAGTEGLFTLLAVFGAAWLVAILLTDKYTHKYPYRYHSYLLASHVKSAVIMAAILGAASWFFAGDRGFVPVLWHAFAWFVVLDLAVSMPRRQKVPDRVFDPSVLKSREVAAQAEPSAIAADKNANLKAPRADTTFADLKADLDPAVIAHVRRTVPQFQDSMSTVIITDRNAFLHGAQLYGAVDLVISKVRVNDIRRINRFFLGCVGRLRMGGHLICQYEPLENRRATIEQRHGGLFWPIFLLHFWWYRACPKIPFVNKLYFALTKGKNRALSKAEVWGRLSFCGLKVVSEEGHGVGRLLIAQRIAPPITNKKPSYYPVVGLTKVGLDGQMLQTHKVRSMYPFSEFLQKQIFDANGLVGTGKFKDDFRLTEYGKFLRRHWIDELPQIYDWLRGDIKLVGMRATSPHFLSLYPEEFIRLYVLVKPGLVPPLFAEGTEGFDAIVQIEFRYLREYARSPFRTDAILLWDTFKAIVFGGVRST